MVMIDLWTRHNPEFDPFGLIDHKFTLMNDSIANLSPAYRWLFDQLGTDQIIWTYACRDNISCVHGSENKIWHLRVPEKEIITVINDIHWDNVIMGYPIYTDEEYEEWEKRISENDDLWLEKFDNFLEQIKNSYGGMENNWKKWVFEVDDIRDNQILIPAPLKPEWVVDVIHASDYDLSILESEISSRCFETKKERDHHIEVMKSLLDGAGIEYKEEIKEYPQGSVYPYIARLEWGYNSDQG